MMRIEFHPEAIGELEAAVAWYSERSQNAARGLIVAVDLAIGSIIETPDRFIKVDSRHQSCSVRRYPCQIVFRRERNHILVVAVAHSKRRVGFWRDR